MSHLLQSNGQPLPLAYGWLVRQGVSTLGNWYFIDDQSDSDSFRQEFIRETAAPNDSAVKDFQPVIRHVACDDFAGFVIRDGRVTGEVVLVHLTFAGRPELPGFPGMTVYNDIWDWLDDCVDVDEDSRLVERLREQFTRESREL
jgi:hypothetical protein